jgi:hypothetical protein
VDDHLDGVFSAKYFMQDSSATYVNIYHSEYLAVEIDKEEFNKDTAKGDMPCYSVDITLDQLSSRSQMTIFTKSLGCTKCDG